MEINLGQSIVPAKPEDFEYFRSLCHNEEGWELHFNEDVTVHSRNFPGSTTKCLRARGLVRGKSADVIFDCLCDDEYRRIWDEVAVELYDICYLDKNSAIGYYCLKCPFPFQNRDFVFQRTWKNISDGCIVMNHSVEIPSHPPVSGVVRGISLITGYHVANVEEGCIATFLSHSDMRVALPQWLCNKVGTYLAPGAFRNMYGAVEGYEEWKSTHNPEYKPWRFEEHRTIQNYADPALLSKWGFPPPPNCLQEKEILVDNPDSDTESFHSADEALYSKEHN
ncbi:PCTP-like protein [Oopsacas minuta]|uniref:PCTP-like protein n=1 Tax=Oopsacas minuta TaxID=111878 RepID=A0AAV7K4V9_9METZ|nr:PCTP-like protein [Oopsacas minuta]